MKVRFVGAGVLLVLLSFAAAAQERMRLTRYVYGYKYTFKVFDEDLQKTPSWNPTAEDVPIPPRKAVDVAKVNIARLLPRFDEKWVLDRIELNQLLKDKWVYEVEFRNDELFQSQTGPDYAFSIFVKMDGTVVEPDVVPNDGKVRIY